MQFVAELERELRADLVGPVGQGGDEDEARGAASEERANGGTHGGSFGLQFIEYVSDGGSQRLRRFSREGLLPVPRDTYGKDERDGRRALARSPTGGKA